MVSGVDVGTVLLAPVLNVFDVLVDNSLTKALGVANISHLGPIIVSDRIEAANCLSSWIVFDESYVPRNVDLVLFFGNSQVFVSHWLWTEAATVVNDIVYRAEECRMPVQCGFAIFLIPLGVEKQIFCKQQFLDLPGVVFDTVGDSKGMIV